MKTKADKLRVRLGELKATIDGLLEASEKNAEHPGELSAEQSAEVDRLMGEFARTKTTLDAVVRSGELAAELEGSSGRKTMARMPGEQPALGGGRITNVTDLREADEMCGYATAQEFARDVRQAFIAGGRPSPKWGAYLDYPQIAGPMREGAATTFHSGASADDGGVLAPPALSRTVFDLMFLAEESIVGLCDVEPTSASDVKKERDEELPWSTTGVVAAWRSQSAGVAMTQAKHNMPKMDNVPVHELYAFIPATNELLEDAPRLVNKLTRKSATKLAWKLEEAVIYGDGAGEPLGYFNSAALVSVAEEGSQAADTIVAANVAKMYSRLLFLPGARPVVLLNNDALPQLMTMTLGDHVIWTPPSQGFASAPGGFLLGMPIRLTQQAKTVGDKGDIQILIPKGYYIARRSNGIDFASSIHLYFDQNMTAFRWTARIGGQPHLSTAVTPNNGSNTLSTFVTLDARAG